MANKNKIQSGSRFKNLTLVIIVLGIGVFGAVSVVFSHAATPPPAPTGSLSCTSSTATSVTVHGSYTNATSSNSVVFYKSGSAVSTYTNGNSSFNYTASGLNPSTNYIFQLRASSGNTALSSINCATTAPPAPTGSLSCSATTLTSVTVNVSYANATSSNSVVFYKSGSAIGTYTNGSQSFAYNAGGLAPSTNYIFQLRESSGNTALSSINCATTAQSSSSPPPATSTPPGSTSSSTTTSSGGAPTGSLTCSATTASSVTIKVSYSNASASNSVIFYKSGSALATYSNGTQSFGYVASGLTASTNYIFQLRASSGNTALSSINCATTAPPAPKGSLTCATTDDTTETIDIAYSDATAANSVVFYMSGAAVATYTNGTQVARYTASNLTPGTNYIYQLRASSGNVALSSINCSTTNSGGDTSGDSSGTVSDGSDSSSDPGAIELDSTNPLVVDSADGSGGSNSFDDSSGISIQDVSSSDGAFVDDGGLFTIDGITSYDGFGRSGVSSDGSGLADSSIYGSDSSVNGVDAADANATPAQKKAKALHAQQVKVVKTSATIGTGVLLAIIAVLVGIILRRRYLDSQLATVPALNTYPMQPQMLMPSPMVYQTIQPTAPPLIQAQPTAMQPVVIAPTQTMPGIQPNAAQNGIATIISNTFYPGSAQSRPTAAPPKDEPIDMYEAARQHPENYGNTRRILGPDTQSKPPLPPSSTPLA